MKTTHPYASPRCEFDKFELCTLIAQSDLTDEGAGDFLVPGDDFTF